MEKAKKKKKTNIETILITGDWNENLLNSYKKFAKLVTLSKTLERLDPTHFTKNSESILHILIVNDSENINFLGLGV